MHLAMKTLGERVRGKRRELGLTQQELATRSGLSQEAISRIEHGKIEGRLPKTLEGLARALHVEVAWLRGEPVNASSVSHASVVSPAPSVTKVEREPVPVVAPEDAESPLEAALGHAFDAERHSLKDLDSVRRVLRSSAQFQHDQADLLEAARTWLDAAAGLRHERHEVTVEALLYRLSLGRRPMQHQLDAFESRKDLLRSEIEATVRAHGVDAGQAKTLGRAIMERMRKLLPRSQ